MRDNANYFISSAAITASAWEGFFREVEANTIQILGIIWLSVQIFYKIKNKGK